MTVCLINDTPVTMYAGQLTLNLVAAVMSDCDRQDSSTERQQLVSWCQKLASMPADDIFSASSPVLYAPIVSTKHRTSRSVIRLVTYRHTQTQNIANLQMSMHACYVHHSPSHPPMNSPLMKTCGTVRRCVIASSASITSSPSTA